MSPTKVQHGLAPDRFPRVSGDEPARARVEQLGVEFSPRERG